LTIVIAKLFQLGSKRNASGVVQRNGWKKGLVCTAVMVKLFFLQLKHLLLNCTVHSLLLKNHPESQHFSTNIGIYNSCFQTTSLEAKTINVGAFMPTFKIQGQVDHIIGSVLLSSEKNHHF